MTMKEATELANCSTAYIHANIMEGKIAAVKTYPNGRPDGIWNITATPAELEALGAGRKRFRKFKKPVNVAKTAAEIETRSLWTPHDLSKLINQRRDTVHSWAKRHGKKTNVHTSAGLMMTKQTALDALTFYTTPPPPPPAPVIVPQPSLLNGHETKLADPVFTPAEFRTMVALAESVDQLSARQEALHDKMDRLLKAWNVQ